MNADFLFYLRSSYKSAQSASYSFQVFTEVENMQSTVQLPTDMYTAVWQQAKARRISVDALVTQWVAKHLQPSKMVEKGSSFEQEIDAFERLMPMLLEKYPDSYVAIYQGKVVGSGDEKMALLRQVREEFGQVTCYIEKVTPEYPQTVRIPSMRVIRS